MADQVVPIAIVGSIAIGLHDRFAPYQDKKILAISLTSGEVVKDLSLSPGYVKHARFLAGKALLVVDSYNLNDPSLSLPVQNASRARLLTLSLVNGAIETQELSNVSHNSGLRLIDSTNGRFGFETFSCAANGTPTLAFVFGTLNGDGRFVANGEVEVMAWSESVDADPRRLTVVSASRVKAYDYDDPTEPLYSLRLVDLNAPPLEALDDTAEFYVIGNTKTSLNANWNSIISVLANDHIPFGSRPENRITELIDAPHGVRIVDGQYLALSANKFSEAGKTVFKYRVTDGFSESEAEVELTIKAITDELRA